VIFWDTSAVVPLLLDEPATRSVRELLESDGAMLVWWGTSVECLSAIARRERDADLARSPSQPRLPRQPRQTSRRARQALLDLAGAWSEILPSEEVREHAGRLFLRHHLRAADAFQLGAALTWTRGRPRRHLLATLDDRLAAAALGEGFEIALPDAV
jgi:predicted nucleic acid-binding protein